MRRSATLMVVRSEAGRGWIVGDWLSANADRGTAFSVGRQSAGQRPFSRRGKSRVANYLRRQQFPQIIAIMGVTPSWRLLSANSLRQKANHGCVDHLYASPMSVTSTDFDFLTELARSDPRSFLAEREALIRKLVSASDFKETLANLQMHVDGCRYSLPLGKSAHDVLLSQALDSLEILKEGLQTLADLLDVAKANSQME